MQLAAPRSLYSGPDVSLVVGADGVAIGAAELCGVSAAKAGFVAPKIAAHSKTRMANPLMRFLTGIRVPPL